jgi:Putative adhesin
VRPSGSSPARHRLSSWGRLVAVSACLVAGSALILTAWWLATRERQVATYNVRGALEGITLDLGAADAEIVGDPDRTAVQVRRTDRFAFGRRAVAEREAGGGVLRLRSRCPSTGFGTCSVAYRLTVPPNVPITVRTSSGNVRIANFQGSARIDTASGDVDVAGFCGFLLLARAQTGDVSASATCACERLELRSRTGDVSARVPPGRYRLDADSNEGARRVRGLVAADDAPFQIQALSTAGDVEVGVLR